MPEEISCGGVPFAIGKGKLNAVVCTGQKIKLTNGCNRVHILAWSKNGDKKAAFSADKKTVSINVPDAFEKVGAWDLIGLGKTGRIKPEKLAAAITHTRSSGNDIYAKQFNIFKFEFDCRSELMLPNDADIILLAITCENTPTGFIGRTSQIDRLDTRTFDYSIKKQDLKRANPSKIENLAAAILDRKESIKISLPQINGIFQWGDFFGLIRSIGEKK